MYLAAALLRVVVRVAVGILYSVSTRGGVVVDDLTFLPCTTAQLEQVLDLYRTYATTTYDGFPVEVWRGFLL